MENNSLGFNQKDNKNNFDVSAIIENNDKIDLLDIQASKLLIEIKRKIGVELDTKKATEIDDDFKKSLKNLIVISNNNITDTYLTEQSYVYFALYNNTLNIYYDLIKKNQIIDYYMLDEKFYNSINNYEEIDWDKYRNAIGLGLFKLAYKYGLESELLSILKINPNFHFYSGRSYESEEIFLKYFKKIIDTFSIEMIANSDLYIFVHVFKQDEEKQEEWINYIKDIYAINPNINLTNYGLLLDDIRSTFDVNQIAFFTDYHFKVIKHIESNYDTYVYEYYCDIIKSNIDFMFFDYRKELLLISFMVSQGIKIPPQIYCQLNEEERDLLYNKFDYYNYQIKSNKISSIITQRQLYNEINKLVKNYTNSNDSKIKRLKK